VASGAQPKLGRGGNQDIGETVGALLTRLICDSSNIAFKSEARLAGFEGRDFAVSEPGVFAAMMEMVGPVLLDAARQNRGCGQLVTVLNRIRFNLRPAGGRASGGGSLEKLHQQTDRQPFNKI